MDRAVMFAAVETQELPKVVAARDRAVLYARVSGDDRGKDGRNPQGQLDMGREYAEEHGYLTVTALHEDDRGASGAAFELPQLKRILDMAGKRQFEVLVVREIDRLSRNLAKQLIVEEELRRAGVRIEYVLGAYPAWPEGDLMKNIRASVAEYERLKIGERMLRGKALKVNAGSIMMNGRRTFGYEVVEVPMNEAQPNGAKRYTLKPFEPEGDTVRLIFQWYVDRVPGSV